MSDIRARTSAGQLKEVRSDLDGRLVSQEPVKAFSFKVTAALSVATTIAASLHLREAELVLVEALFNTAPTTAENFTVTLTSHRGVAEYDVLLRSNDPSVGAITSLLMTWNPPYPLEVGDEITVAYTNTDARTIAGRIVIRPVS